MRRERSEVPDRAYGHTKEPTGFRETDQSSTSATLGDGGVYSCLEDLAKWDEALRTNALLSKAEMAPALTPVRLADGSEPRWPEGEQGGDNSPRPPGRLRLRLVPGAVAGTEARLAPRRDDGLPVRSSSASRRTA